MSTGKKDARGGNQTDGDALIQSDFSLVEYNMNHSRRGIALIFNQKNFDEHMGANNTIVQLDTRYGTDADRDNLRDRLKELNFEVRLHDDLTKEGILAEIRKVAVANHVDADCFCCVFLSHGEKDKVYARDKEISIQEVTALFKGDKCRSLVGKPKIFILQACRGKERDLPVTGMCAEDSDEEENNKLVVEDGVVHTLPAGADFLMCYSVAEGYVSFRNSFFGSWYIQDLCKTLEKCSGSLEFTELLTLVNRKVSTRPDCNPKQKELKGKKQVPCFASMLTKKLYFRPKQ